MYTKTVMVVYIQFEILHRQIQQSHVNFRNYTEVLQYRIVLIIKGVYLSLI